MEKVSQKIQNMDIKVQCRVKIKLLSNYIERAFSQGLSSIDSSHMTQSPKHWRHVIIPCCMTLKFQEL